MSAESPRNPKPEPNSGSVSPEWGEFLRRVTYLRDHEAELTEEELEVWGAIRALALPDSKGSDKELQGVVAQVNSLQLADNSTQGQNSDLEELRSIVLPPISSQPASHPTIFQRAAQALQGRVAAYKQAKTALQAELDEELKLVHESFERGVLHGVSPEASLTGWQIFETEGLFRPYDEETEEACILQKVRAELHRLLVDKYHPQVTESFYYTFSHNPENWKRNDIDRHMMRIHSCSYQKITWCDYLKDTCITLSVCDDANQHKRLVATIWGDSKIPESGPDHYYCSRLTPIASYVVGNETSNVILGFRNKTYNELHYFKFHVDNTRKRYWYEEEEKGPRIAYVEMVKVA